MDRLRTFYEIAKENDRKFIINVSDAPYLEYLSKDLVTAKTQMVAAANPHASRAGLEVLRQGGSALDAAIAVQMVLNVVEPQS